MKTELELRMKARKKFVKLLAQEDSGGVEGMEYLKRYRKLTSRNVMMANVSV